MTNPVEQPMTHEEQMQKIKRDVEERMKSNPYIREHMEAQKAVEASRGKPKPKESPFLYDEEGNYIGVKPEYKNKVSPYEQMQEIRKNTERKLNGGGA